MLSVRSSVSRYVGNYSQGLTAQALLMSSELQHRGNSGRDQSVREFYASYSHFLKISDLAQ